jgi:hypothetical protein
MILSDDEIQQRIESPLNLLNRLKTAVNRRPSSQSHQHPALPPTAEDIVEDLEDKIKNASMRSKAVNILNSAMDELGKRLPEIQKPERLAQIAREMSQVVSNQDNKPQTGHTSKIIIYAPQVQSLDSFDIIDVVE